MAASLNYKDIVNGITRKNEDIHFIGEEKKEKLKKCLYEMAIDLDIRCRKNGLKMFLVGGSLLGAVRHGGFIPWDDDMDFAMERTDYRKMIQVFEKEFGDKYMLRCPNSPYPNGNRFMQIYKKGTLLKTIGDGNSLQPDCVYIDIFPYDYVPNDMIYRRIKGIKSNILMLIASCVMDSVYSNEEYKTLLKNGSDGKGLILFRSIIGRVFSIRKPEKWFNCVDNVIAFEHKSHYVTSATGRKHYFGEIYPADTFFPLSSLNFIEHKFYAPQKFQEYLKGLYGVDYMDIPDKNKRENHFITEFVLEVK